MEQLIFYVKIDMSDFVSVILSLTSDSCEETV